MNKKILGVSMLLIGLAAVMAFLGKRESNEYISALRTKATATTYASGNASSAYWVSNAMTVNELLLESDLVVRARVSEAPVTRVVRIEAPVMDEKGNSVDSAVFKVLFSDTMFEVLETYVGKSSTMITVMQNGGFDLTVSKGIEQRADDPLYGIGEEYILFLVDISGDHIHAPDRELYRAVNPFGRYRIDGRNVFSYGENLKSVQLPAKVTELETQIEQAAQEHNK